MHKLPFMNKRIFPLVGLLLCCSSLLIAYFYFQLYMGLPPCPLCILDRWILAGLGLGFLLLSFNIPILNGCAILWNWLLLLAGFAVGGRHLWLEYFPARELTSCIPPQGSSSWLEWLTDAFIGTADCSLILWSFAGLSIAGWTFVLYIVLLLFMLFSHRRA